MIQIPADYHNEEINIEQLPPVEAITWVPLAPRYLRVMRLSILLGYTIGMVFATFFLWLSTQEESGWVRWVPLAPIAFFALLYLINLFWMRKAYALKGYALRERDLSYRSGFFIRKVKTVPIQNVQQVTMKQGLFSRIYGLYSLHISDASQGDDALVIPGLPAELAEEMKQYIISQVAEQREAHSLPQEEVPTELAATPQDEAMPEEEAISEARANSFASNPSSEE